jgi:hypothetical protein
MKLIFFLSFKNKQAIPNGGIPSVSDMAFDGNLISAAEKILVEKRRHGAVPTEKIFDRPILRSRAPRMKDNRASAPWDNRANVSLFPSALQAVQLLSYGSTKVRHVDSIDDILIANNIANSADGNKTESYNYWWSWQDKAVEIQRQLEPVERQRSTETSSHSFIAGVSNRLGSSRDDGSPMSIFGLRCGPMCSSDTTTS